MAEFRFGEVEVSGKKLKDWLMSDEGLVDYEKCEFKRNVSNKKGRCIFDLGEYEFDSSVGVTTYHNGVDLARVAGAVMYDEPYYGMRMVTALNGDDYVRIFKNSFTDATLEDFVLYFFKLLDGEIYISETNYHVFVKGRSECTDEEWKATVDELYSRSRHHK